MTVDIRNAGRRFGYLTVAYSIQGGRDVACRCCCNKLVHIAVADLAAGLITSCGCQPASPQFHERRVELRAQQQREITFSIALMRR